MEDEHKETFRRLKKEHRERKAKKRDRVAAKEQEDTNDPPGIRTLTRRQQEEAKRNAELARSAASRSRKRRSKRPESSHGQPAEPPKKLPVGFEVKTNSGKRYVVEGQLAGRVYVARNKRSERLYAMKVEMHGQEDVKQLKRDLAVMKEAFKHPARLTRHFPRLHGKGRVKDVCSYMLMSLCDLNLNDIRSRLLDGCDFSRPNAARLAMQTFQAVHDLHLMGFMHRDLSPSKFVLGIDNAQLVYLVGFSLAVHFRHPADSKPSASPRRLPKMAARSFLPRAYHRGKNMHRKDDLESWLFLCFDLFGRRILPWNESFSDLDLYANKERLFCGGCEECFKYVPRQFETIVHHVAKLEGRERPDYELIGVLLLTIKQELNFHYYGPFDWQKKHEAAKFGKEEAIEFALAEKNEKLPSSVAKHEEKRHKEASDDEDEDESDGAESKKAAESAASRKSKQKRAGTPQVASARLDVQLIPVPKEEIAAAVEAKKPGPNAQPTAADLMAQMEAMRKQNERMAARLDALVSARQSPTSKKANRKKADDESGQGVPLRNASAKLLVQEKKEVAAPSKTSTPAEVPAQPSKPLIESEYVKRMGSNNKDSEYA